METASTNPSKKSGINLFLVVIIAWLAFYGGYAYGDKVFNNLLPAKQIEVVNKTPQTETLDMGLFWQVVDLINQKFLYDEKIDGKKLAEGAINGMVGALGDPYTSFYSPQANEAFIDNLEGFYEGIGAQLGFNKENMLVVVAPLDDSPAQQKGLQPNDVILSVGEEQTTGWSIPQAVDKIRGETGTEVTLTLFREGTPEPFQVAITRAEIQIPAVRYTWVKKDGADTKVAHVRVLRFGSDTKAEWDTMVDELVKEKAKGLVLDLRNNPGGYLDASIYLASEFFKDGVVVKRESNTDIKEFNVDHACRFCDIPVVGLINQGSASASEIFMGALQARDRAELVGEKSFGKGTVQDAVNLGDGASFHVTVAKWLLPNNQNLHGEGLTPEHVVETEVISGPYGDGSNDTQLQKAIELLSAK